MRKWKTYTAKEIKPEGWIKKQLEIQAKGLCGNLDRFWPDVRDSAWIGGNCDGWERVPYWLDGFIPLAYLLDDEDMKSRAKRYVDAILSNQKPDGWICPCPDDRRSSYDPWAVLLITKVLVVYYECSGDERVPDAVYRVLRNYYEMLSDGKASLFRWGKYRWFEGLIAVNFIYERCGEEWLVKLAKLLKAQGADYNALTELWKKPLNMWRFETHIVNIGMMLKSEAVSCDILGDEYTDNAEKLHDILEKYNSTAVEIFTGDEVLAGLSPIHGTELCSVVEQMYSYELLYAYTGDKKWAERLETIAFNALPATLTSDMWAHQYVQMSNQIACETFPGKSLFRTNPPECHIFGLEPGGPGARCCTTNHGQGWPKFALSAFLHSDDTVLSAQLIPSRLSVPGVTVALETDYPFENSLKYTINADRDFTFKVRIPSFAEDLTVNGSAAVCGEDGCLCFDVRKGDTVISVSFNVTPCFKKRPYDLRTVRCGSLVFSVPVKYEKRMREFTRDGVERKFPYCDYELLPVSDWEYAYSSSDLELVRNGLSGDFPFSEEKPPVVIKAKVKKIAWGTEDGYEKVCAKVPGSREALSEESEILLVPYGCAKLRMTEIPLI